jgi:O-antigen/teichoic acid export membrane protein
MHAFLNQSVLNALSNVAGSAANIIAGIVTVAHLVASLGVEVYGLWALIAALTGFLFLLDLGIGGAMGRLIAMRRASGLKQEINAIMSTAAAVLIAVCIVIGVLTVVSPTVFFELFQVSQQLKPDIARALLLSGFNIALMLPACIFSGYLWGHERFDVLNAIEIPLVILRTALIVLLVDTETTLTEIASIIFICNTLSSVLRGLACIHLDRELRLRPSLVDSVIVRELYGFGLWYFMLSMSRMILPQIGLMITGSKLPGAPVALFAVARQLTGYINSCAIDVTQVMAPRAAALHARSEIDKQEALLLDGGRFALALALFLAGGVLCLGWSFLHVWQRDRLNHAYLPLLILVAGETLPMSQWLTYSLVLGKSRHRFLALLSILEGIAMVILTFPAVRHYGLIGVCIAVAIPGFVLRGIVQWLYGCHLLSMPPWRYVRYVFLPVTPIAAVPILVSYCTLSHAAPDTWVSLVLGGLFYAATYTLAFGAIFLANRKLRPFFGAAHN